MQKRRIHPPENPGSAIYGYPSCLSDKPYVTRVPFTLTV